MQIQNRVNATLAPADREAVLASIEAAREKLPFLIDLTAEERHSIIKMGDKSRGFVLKALEVANQNPAILPRSFNIEEMRNDIQLFEDLQPVLMAINKLQDLVEDTVMEAGGEAYAAALAVYSYVKASGAGEALEVAADDLGRRFARKGRVSQPDPAPSPSNAQG